MMISTLQAGGPVSFPAFTGERIYMVPFFKEDGLPAHLRRWQRTVDDMLEGVETEFEIYLMVDQKMVEAEQTHRRPGLHIDGYWCSGIQAHGVGGHSVGGGEGPGHNTGRHRLEDLPPVPTKRKPKPRPKKNASAAEAILLASDLSACEGFEGEFDYDVPHGGNCENVNTFRLQRTTMRAGRVYAGNAHMLHQSLPVHSRTTRTVVRLNVPGWSP